MWRDISYWIHFQFICHYRHLKNQIQKKKKVSVQRTENLCIHHLGNDDGKFLAVVYDVRNHIVTLISLLLMQRLCQGLLGYTAEFTYIVSK